MVSARGALQWLLILFSTLSVIFAIFALTVGSFQFNKFSKNSPQYMEEIIQLVSASLLLIAGLVGCCGAIYNSIPTLVVYILMFVVLLLSHGWKLFRYDEVNLIKATETFVTYKWIEELSQPGPMRELELQYECCGKDGSNDYTDVGMLIPDTCYQHELKAANGQPYHEGCTISLTRRRLKVMRSEWIAHWTMIGVECFGISLTGLLIWRIASKQQRYQYY